MRHIFLVAAMPDCVFDFIYDFHFACVYYRESGGAL